MIYKNGRIFGIINIIDLFVVLIVAAAAIILAPKFIGGSTNVITSTSVGEVKTVYFTVQFRRAASGFSEKISIGDTINDNTKGYYYGEVYDIHAKPAEMITENTLDGTYQNSVIPNEEDVSVTIKCNGTESDREIKAEGQVIKLGQVMVLKGKGYAGSGYVVDLYTE